MNQQINKYIYEMYLQYKQEKFFKLDFLLLFVSIMIQTIIYILLFKGILGNSRIDLEYIISYYLVVNVVCLSMEPAQFVSWKHMDDMNSGNIILRLYKPESYPLVEYLRCLVKFIIKSSVNLIVVFLGAIIFNKNITFSCIIQGIASLLIGFTIFYLIQGCIGCLTPWIKDITRIRDVFFAVLLILGGKVIPSQYLYSSIKKIIYFTPIPYIYDVPTRVLAGEVGIIYLIGQLIWLGIWCLVYCYLYKKAIKEIDYGG